jgi:hypothetical protein
LRRLVIWAAKNNIKIRTLKKSRRLYRQYFARRRRRAITEYGDNVEIIIE